MKGATMPQGSHSGTSALREESTQRRLPHRSRRSARPLLIAGIAAIASVSLVSPAFATTTINDPLNDAIAYLENGQTTATDYGDISSITVDYIKPTLTTTVNFQYLEEDVDINTLIVQLDTNGDNETDYVIGTIDGESLAENSSSLATTPVSTKIVYGAPGSYTYKLPTAFLGNPASLRVSVAAAWIEGEDVANVDTAPNFDFDSGDFAWSAAIAPSLQQTVIPVVKLSASSQTYGKTSVTARVTVPAAAAGTVRFSEGSKTIGTAKVTKGVASLALPKSLNAGKHTIVATFVPQNTAAYSGKSATFKLTVKAATTKLTAKVKSKKLAIAVTSGTATKASGKATIKEGKKKVATVKVKNGKATFTLTKKLKSGKHKLTVSFTPSSKNFKAPKAVKVTVKNGK